MVVVGVDTVVGVLTASEKQKHASNVKVYPPVLFIYGVCQLKKQLPRQLKHKNGQREKRRKETDRRTYQQKSRI